jgi:hypothetical protein
MSKSKQIVESYKAHYLHKYHLEGIDLEKELELIKQKKSNLSRSQRDAVVAAFQIFPVIEKTAEKEEKEVQPIEPEVKKEEKEERNEEVENVKSESEGEQHSV